jgi:hypothetical protein
MTDIGYTVDQAKGQFFDREAVIKSAGKGLVRWANKSGGLVRKIARQSMRRRQKSSPAGTPPSAHVGLIRDRLFYVWEPQRKTIVVGPALLNRPDRDALQVLEHGGDAMRKFFVENVESAKRTKSGQVRTKNETRIRFSRKAPARRVHYDGNPFMGPALDKALPALTPALKDSIRT